MEWQPPKLRFVPGVIVCSIALVYTSFFLFRGWYPHDEGLLAQSAERVLEGQLPHIDFDETYTGGLTFLHALEFKLLGHRLDTMRIFLFVFFGGFVLATYALLVRLLSVPFAGLFVMLCVVWSLPNYSASMPSWYNLFLATFGLVALFRFLESENLIWLFVAGLFAGISVLVKVTGLAFLVAVILSLVFKETLISQNLKRARRIGGFFTIKALLLGLLVGSLLFVVSRRFSTLNFLLFVVPTLSCCSLLVWLEWCLGGGSLGGRLRQLARWLLPLGAGFVIPIACFLIVYVISSGLQELIYGLTVMPSKRLEHAAFEPPLYLTLAFGLPYGLYLTSSLLVPKKQLRLAPYLLIGFYLGALIYGHGALAWLSALLLGPIVVTVGCLMLGKAVTSSTMPQKRQLEVFQWLAVCALLGLIQFPFTTHIYFFYVAPILAVCAVAVCKADHRVPLFTHFCTACFYLLFGLVALNPPVWKENRSPLRIERAGILINESISEVYESLVAEVQKHAQPGEYIYATPDCPEVYFLSGMKNPTRVMFEFLDDRYSDTEVLLSELKRHSVNLVVINELPSFSSPVSEDLRRALAGKWRYSKKIGWFEVRWSQVH